jgi:lipoprotein-anchoring transpeptidase ErfK/SrfK
MADYFSVIKRSVETLNPNTREARRALYERARGALLERLRAAEPRLPAPVIEAEQASLEAAISRIEAELSQRRSPLTVPPAVARVFTPRTGADTAAPAARPAAAQPPPPPPPTRPVDFDQDAPPPEAEEEEGSRRLLASSSPVLFIVIGALLIAAGGIAAYLFWPASRPAQQTASAPAPASTQAPASATAPAPRQRAAPAVNYVYLRQPVYYRTTHPVGTIVIDKAQNFLYVVRPNVVAIRYGIGLGRECTNVQGLYRVTRKEEWPGFSGRAEDRLKNPLGARAIYFDEKYRIHGTNAPAQVIGDDVNVGCLHLSNEDVIELSDKTPIDTRVVVTE